MVYIGIFSFIPYGIYHLTSIKTANRHVWRDTKVNDAQIELKNIKMKIP